MKLLIFCTLFALSPVLYGQTEFHTGSAVLDKELNWLNEEANKDLLWFKTTISEQLAVNLQQVNQLLMVYLEPAEVWMCLALAELSARPMEDVAGMYLSYKNRGWNEVALLLGVDPNGSGFAQLSSTLREMRSTRV